MWEYTENLEHIDNIANMDNMANMDKPKCPENVQKMFRNMSKNQKNAQQ